LFAKKVARTVSHGWRLLCETFRSRKSTRLPYRTVAHCPFNQPRVVMSLRSASSACPS
jgi:hypothetical protein